MMKKKLKSDLACLWVILVMSTMQVQPMICGCPALCRCMLSENRKTTTCSDGGRTRIPVSEIDETTHAIIVTAPENNENNITIGRIFINFYNLEILKITRSKIPAIGESTFWPGRRLKVLDLSHNSIRFLRASDFNGLKNLQELDLSFNRISATPSAPFRHLDNLSRLLLANNELTALVPRFFYPLSKLAELDLSGNAFHKIDPDHLQDVRGLKALNFANCRLTSLHPVLYQRMPQLETMELSGNSISSIAPEEYRHLKSLRYLHLDNNRISRIPDNAFDGHSFRSLSLSNNTIIKISPLAFFNSSVHFLNISHNQISDVPDDAFRFLRSSTEILDISGNVLSVEDFLAVVKPLKSLKVIHAALTQLRELPENALSENPQLLMVNFSHNQMEIIPDIDQLTKLEVIDFSYNKLSSVSETTLRKFSTSTSLGSVKLHGNPYHCTSCDIQPLVQWMNSSSFFNSSCQDFDVCLRCVGGTSGRLLHTVTSDELQLYCSSIEFGALRSLEYASKTGLYVAISIIIVIAIIIVFTIYVYRSHFAHYYTNEDRHMPCKVVANSPPAAFEPRCSGHDIVEHK